jgi:hypothetical protein
MLLLPHPTLLPQPHHDHRQPRTSDVSPDLITICFTISDVLPESMHHTPFFNLNSTCIILDIGVLPGKNISIGAEV